MNVTDLDILAEFIRNAQREVREALADKKLSAKMNKGKIEGIHNRLIQNLLLHLGVVMLEV